MASESEQPTGWSETVRHQFPGAPKAEGDRKRIPWLRRILITLFVLIFVVPVGLVGLYRFVPPPTTPLILSTRLTVGPVRQDWVPLSEMSANLVKAVIASEDGKFCSHTGFDWEAIDDAMEYNASGQGLRGASTISQQTAKNLFLPTSRNWARKGIEAYFTVLIEFLWPKWRIMETYLNVVELGEGNFGVEAAAQAYFGKSAAELTRTEAARLAAVLPNPRAYRVVNPGSYVSGRTNRIASMMTDVTRDRLDGCVVPYPS
jgi:monofunctional biosynthetic peptidoglycan transglycosylase